MELYLLTKPANEDKSISHRLLRIKNTQWELTGPWDLSSQSAIPDFACISYVWGPKSQHIANSLHQGRKMSPWTLPSFAAAISLAATTKSAEVAALWIDSFCVPVAEPARAATLASMGYIYSAAKEVIVALMPERSFAIKELSRSRGSDGLSDQSLQSLENDEWIRSVWTYQEVVNSKQLYLTTTNMSDPDSIDGNTFLNRLGYSLEIYRKSRGLDQVDLRRIHPMLDAFDDLPLERPPGLSMEGLIETTMQLCEQKSDYSFIFCTASRDNTPGRRWRPSREKLCSILPWFSSGSRQSGRHDSAGLWLERVICLQPLEIPTPTVSEEEINWNWLKELPDFISKRARGRPRQTVEQDIPDLLAALGFKGKRDFLRTDTGVFYPLEMPPSHSTPEVISSSEVYWMFGSPGLVRWKDRGTFTYSPGVYIGTVNRSQVSDCLLL
ncbi:hypothetical protein M752DRAFT_271519 [Aspergillus phoenicis ATCC 13157]|uniref:Heterokaryon incompatibility domain-containing protein n=1 Tax=Aspergillus phoenicis ATCC 13157 TaxID=1353007 RepID=A0A370P3T9_ASPPH|nr:hypothetical protein M752DRAFT_271519 [Aspergillus phoenicis ATCC 13157]